MESIIEMNALIRKSCTIKNHEDEIFETLEKLKDTRIWMYRCVQVYKHSLFDSFVEENAKKVGKQKKNYKNIFSSLEPFNSLASQLFTAPRKTGSFTVTNDSVSSRLPVYLHSHPPPSFQFFLSSPPQEGQEME